MFVPCWLIFDAIATQVAMTCPRFPSTVVDNSPLTSPPQNNKFVQLMIQAPPVSAGRGVWGERMALESLCPTSALRDFALA